MPNGREDGVTTHIIGFDDILEPNSLPARTTIIVSGPMGCGKTTFVMDYLIKGVLKERHFAIFVSLEETGEHILRDYSNFIWGSRYTIKDMILRKSDLENKENIDPKRRLIIIDGVTTRIKPQVGVDYKSARSLSDLIGEDGMIYLDNVGNLRGLLDKILGLLQKEFNARFIRVGIDSLTAYLSAISSTIRGAHRFAILDELRKNILELRSLLESYPVTTLMTSEAFRENQTRFGVEEFISRGVIFLGYQWIGSTRIRYLTIVKMRGRKHRMAKYGFEINPKYGIRLLSEVF